MSFQTSGSWMVERSIAELATRGIRMQTSIGSTIRTSSAWDAPSMPSTMRETFGSFGFGSPSSGRSSRKTGGRQAVISGAGFPRLPLSDS